MGSSTGATWPRGPNSIRIRGLACQRPRRRTAVRPPKRRLTWPSSRFINNAERQTGQDLAALVLICAGDAVAGLRPAADIDGLAGDEARLVAAQKRDHARDVLRLADALQRNLRGRADLEGLEVDAHPFGGGASHPRLAEPRRDRVDVDV